MFLLTITIGYAVKNYHHSVMRTNNGALITITAASETLALEGAEREAQEYAKKQGANDYKIVDGTHVKHVGPEREGTGGIIKGVADALIKRDKSQDYKCTMIIELAS